MTKPSFEGIFVALLPQRGAALVEVLRDAAQQVLGERDQRGWAIEFGPIRTPAGAVAFRLSSLTERFPWRDGALSTLAQAVSRLGKGRCWGVALEKPAKSGEGEGWAEGVVYDRGERTGYEDATGAEAANELLAWFGEQLALSENELLAVFESCDQSVGVLEGKEQFGDEVDALLDKARKEFLRYRELCEQRERQRS